MSKVLDLNIEVDFENPLPAMKEIVKILMPEWNVENVKYEDKSTGFVNRNYKVYVPENNDALLIRCATNKTSPIFKSQKLVNRFIHDAKLGPKMYCTLENGVCVEFLEGKTYPWGQTPLLYDSEDLWPQTAEIMALYHSKKTYERAKSFGVGHREATVQRGVPRLDQFHASSDKSVPSGSMIWAELEWYVRLADKLTPGRRFVHMDPNGTNWLVRDNRQLVLIDYDINCIFYPTADIGWFFLSRCNMTNPNMTDYPDVEYRKKWLRHYLTKLRELDGEPKEVTDEDVDEMERKVDVGLTYAFLQSTLASININLHGNRKPAKQRLTPWTVWWEKYQKKKVEYFSLGYE